jgi:hypothetical protein
MKMNTTTTRRSRRLLALTGIGGALVFGFAQGSTALAASYPGTQANGFNPPVKIPSSTGLGEPSITHDNGAGNGGVDRLFVIAPAGVPTIAGGHPSSPLFTSTDGGATWTGPVYDTFCAGAAGGDSDVITDPSDNVYTTDLSLANSCLGVSEPPNPGSSYTAGNPYGTGYTAGDDRPWLAFGNTNTRVYGTWDGLDGIHVYNSAPTNVNAATGIASMSDQIAIPESLLNQNIVNTGNIRDCVCPPGGIAIDNSGKTHDGRIYASFSSQNGMGIAFADPVAGVVPPTTSWSYTYIPDIPTGGSAFQDEWNFSPIKVDSNGTVYVMWSHATIDNSSSTGYGAVQEYYAYSTDGGAHFSSPYLLSTEAGTTTFPAMDVAGPGELDLTWYGDPAHAVDPNLATGPWNVYYERLTNADTATPTIVTGPEVAISGMHTGCIQTGGGAQCGDRSLLDFFDITDTPCASGAGTYPNIIYAGGDVNAGVDLFFTKLPTACAAAVNNPVVPEAPWTGLLVIPGAAAAFIGIRRHRRRPAL